MHFYMYMTQLTINSLLENIRKWNIVMQYVYEHEFANN